MSGGARGEARCARRVPHAGSDRRHGPVGRAVEPRRYQTVYVDTEDLRLARWGCSLRHRDGEGWTLKLPATQVGLLLVRGEHRFDGDARHVPPDAVDLRRSLRSRRAAPPGGATTDVAAHGGASGRPRARPPARSSTTRSRSWTGRAWRPRFRELEVEVAATVQKATVAPSWPRWPRPARARPRVCRSTCRPSRARSAPPEVVVPELGPDASVGEVVRGAIAASVVRLLRHDAGGFVSARTSRTYTRRASRRAVMRSDLRSFRDRARPEWDASLRDELGWLGGELATVRDLDVQLARLSGRVAELPEEDRATATRLVDGLRAGREQRARTPPHLDPFRPVPLALLDRLVIAGASRRSCRTRRRLRPSSPLGSVMERPWKHLKGALDACPRMRPTPTCTSRGSARNALGTRRSRGSRLRQTRARVRPRGAADLQDVLGGAPGRGGRATWLARRPPDRAPAFVAGELACRRCWRPNGCRNA